MGDYVRTDGARRNQPGRSVRLQPGSPARVLCALGWKPDHGGLEPVTADQNGAIRKVAGGGAAAFFLSAVLIGGAPAQVDGFGEGNRPGAPRYTFTTLLDSQRDGLEPTRCAAINTLGTVAVTVRDSVSGSTMIITKRGANDLPVVVADTGPVADFPTFCDNGFTSLPSDPSINELGEVAFQGNLQPV